jgi:Tfp pilus assembly protein PilX
MTTMTTRSHTYPTARAQAASRARRARARGAVMVEALIVISLLILGFIGLAFFREYYVKSLVASRLARGSILVY